MSPPSHSCTSSKFGSKNFVTCRVRKFYLTSDSNDKTEILRSYENVKKNTDVHRRLWSFMRMFTQLFTYLYGISLLCPVQRVCGPPAATAVKDDRASWPSSSWQCLMGREPRGTQIEVSSSALCPVPDVLPFWPCSIPWTCQFASVRSQQCQRHSCLSLNTSRGCEVLLLWFVSHDKETRWNKDINRQDCTCIQVWYWTLR